jgi:uncharacterized membrane protein YphA (DoxX/SURF4 family)
MNTILWILQVVLALTYLSHGWLMLTVTTAVPQPMMAYILDIPVGLRRFIGVAEVLAGVGLVLPALTSILPWLTPLAAAGLALVMLGAVIFHAQRREYPNIAFNLVLLAIVAFVAYGRFVAVPL